jgi:hypothetical protein
MIGNALSWNHAFSGVSACHLQLQDLVLMAAHLMLKRRKGRAAA